MFVKLTLWYQPGTIFFDTKPTKIIYRAYGLFTECSADVMQMQGANCPADISFSAMYTRNESYATLKKKKINSFQIKTLNKKILLKRRKKTINCRVEENQ